VLPVRFGDAPYQATVDALRSASTPRPTARHTARWSGTELSKTTPSKQRAFGPGSAGTGKSKESIGSGANEAMRSGGKGNAMADEFMCNTSEVGASSRVKEIVSGTGLGRARLAAIRPHFSRMMADPDWLPAEFRRIPEAGGWQRIANWLLYRDTEGTLSLCALVLPSGGATPVHDHLAWGLVGLYVGEQDEEIYEAAMPVGPDDRHTDLTLVAKKHLGVGSFYELTPPTGDIHRSSPQRRTFHLPSPAGQ